MSARRADGASDKSARKLSKKIRLPQKKSSRKQQIPAEVCFGAETSLFDWNGSTEVEPFEPVVDIVPCVSNNALVLSSRLDEFKTLEDGWLEGFGRAPSVEGLDWLKDFFANSYPTDLPIPLLAPTEEGGVSAEWFLRRRDVDASLDFDLETRKAEWHCLVRSTGEDDFQEMDANSAEDLAIVFEKLRAWAAEEA